MSNNASGCLNIILLGAVYPKGKKELVHEVDIDLRLVLRVRMLGTS
jgi:hypothetical protein